MYRLKSSAQKLKSQHWVEYLEALQKLSCTQDLRQWMPNLRITVTPSIGRWLKNRASRSEESEPREEKSFKIKNETWHQLILSYLILYSYPLHDKQVKVKWRDVTFSSRAPIFNWNQFPGGLVQDEF